MKSRLLLLFFLIALSRNAFPISFSFNETNITFNNEKKDGIELNPNWRFSIGDNPEWLNPNFNFSKWDTVFLPFTIQELLPFNYKGNVWLRTTFKLKNEIVSESLSLIIKQFGASEIYIDGQLIQKFGTVGNTITTEEPYKQQHIPVTFKVDTARTHTIVIRYSNHSILTESEAELDAFDIRIVDAETGEFLNKIKIIKENILTAIGIGIFLTLAIINFILFLFHKRDKSNLYYSIFSVAIAITFVINIFVYSCNSASSELLLDKLRVSFLMLSNFFLIALVYSFIYQKNPKRLKIILFALIIGLSLVLLKFEWAKILGNVFKLYCIIDIVVVILKSYSEKYDPTRKKRKRFWLLITIMVLLAIIGFFINPIIPVVIFSMLVLTIMLPIAGIIFIIPLYMTIRHARSFAITNASLEEQLVQVKELSEKAILQEQEKKKILESQNERLELMVDKRTAELAEKNLEIKDSINYALRIQKAILTSKDEINEGLKNCFILFKPKDIVSGDFYFYSKNENNITIAAADCTGHGVPGALMSMIGSEKLMSTAKESSSPSIILNSLNKGIKSSLRQTDKEESTKDGMDIALVSINLENNKATYAGANRPIWIIKSNSKEVQEIKATKKAIGGFTEDEQHFEQHELQFNTGDTFYLFTDGYADQFGHTGKKLMTKKFREILLDIQSMPMQEQETYLDDFIENWKKDADQVDDILVIGVRI